MAFFNSPDPLMNTLDAINRRFGRGRPPRWLAELTVSGRAADEFLVARK